MITNMPHVQEQTARRRAQAARLLLLFAAFSVAGCGRPATTVTGIVTLNGQPLSEASVQFYSVNGKGQPVGTSTDAAGRYRATVSPSPQRVVISKREVTGYHKDKTDLVDGGTAIVEELVPADYTDVVTTPLIAQPVENMDTTTDFELFSSTLQLK